ncbi:maltase A1 [Anabrus simplex]|uniref:maltase A1 n=1 Tax=Anabrus simplex TaxID=316456 RepID=UPI0035A2C88C
MTSLSLLATLLVTLAVTSSADLEWWQTGVIYQIYPRSFMDSNGDGIGDLEGIRQKLTYLKNLGVTGIWLSPIYKSPMADFGYDIADFRNIAEEYGTMNDFDNLLNDTHALGMKLILDFVPNHSSDEHEWFVKGTNPDDPDFAKYKQYYVWRDAKEDGSPPNNWNSVFGTGVPGDGWQWNEKVGQYYLHQFDVKQPDLNYRNPELVQEMKDVITFWLDRGVDGFRVDAIPHLFEDSEWRDNPPNSNERVTNQPETYDMVEQWRTLVDKYPDKVMMLEAYASTEQTMAYFGTKERPGGHFPFNFFIISNLHTDSINAAHVNDLIHQWVDNVPSFGWSNWVVGNHDNSRVATRLGTNYVDTMNMLVTLLPGTAITYDGEEIGMTDNRDITFDEGKDPQGCIAGEDHFQDKSRDFERSPFQWDDSKNAGFSTADTTWLPVNQNYKTLNVEAQLKDPKSHLNIYKKLAEARKDPVVQNGDLTTLVVDTNVLSFARTLESSVYVVVINLGGNDVSVDLSNKFGINSDSLDVYVSSSNSALSEGQRIQLSNIQLEKYAAVVLTNTA